LSINLALKVIHKSGNVYKKEGAFVKLAPLLIGSLG